MRGSGALQPRLAAVFVLLALPDWSLFFQPVDRMAQGGERFFPVRSADMLPITDPQIKMPADSESAGQVPGMCRASAGSSV